MISHAQTNASICVVDLFGAIARTLAHTFRGRLHIIEVAQQAASTYVSHI